MKLDETDVRILKVLLENGRLSFRQIAERVKVSVPTISSKISNIEGLGLIQGYQAVLDTERMGEISVVIEITAKPNDLVTVAEEVRDLLNVRSLYLLGSARILTICSFYDQRAVNDFLISLNGMGTITDYKVANVIDVVKEEQRAMVIEGMKLIPSCEQCGKDIEQKPVKVKRDGKDLYFCDKACAEKFN